MAEESSETQSCAETAPNREGPSSIPLSSVAPEVPDFVLDQDGVYQALENTVWRKAGFVDGKLRWASNNLDSVGEPVPKVTYKVRSFGNYFLLAAKEEENDEDGPHSDKPEELTNDERIDALLDKVATELFESTSGKHTLEDAEDSEAGTANPPLSKENIKAALWQDLESILPQITSDDVLAIDVHGKLDLDFDNPGPALIPRSQFISLGYHALKNRDKDSAFANLQSQLQGALLPREVTNEEEDGMSDSGGSEVSVDNCSRSPFYPACGADCWLKSAQSLPTDASMLIPEAENMPSPKSPDVYQKLDSGFMRVLSLGPGTGSEPVNCKLELIGIPGVVAPENVANNALAFRREFEALSYTWRAPKRGHVINCNGQPFAVGSNLFHALIDLRLASTPRVLWIDALCINQDDISERNEQVQHMYAIYKSATRVVVWIGPADEDGQYAMQGMKYLRNSKNRRAIMRRDHEPSCLKQLGRLVIALESFNRRPWFTRSWVRQEVAAARNVAVICGSTQMSWRTMKRAMNCLWRLRQKLLSSQDLAPVEVEEVSKGLQDSERRNRSLTFLKRDWIIGQSLLAESADLRSIWYYHTGSFLELLMVGRAFDATDARDKVYSVLGMSEVPIEKGADEEANRATNSMRIDYSAKASSPVCHDGKRTFHSPGCDCRDGHCLDSFWMQDADCAPGSA